MTTTTAPEPLFDQRVHFSGEREFYRGKVRDVHTLEDGRLLMVASDRISAFDVVLPRPIPFKGQVLNQLAGFMLNAVSDLVPTWLEATPDPNVAIGKCCEPIRLEMVIRGHLTGHAWRTYRDGGRVLCGVPMPDGMREHDAFEEPIITPATKAEEGHDEDISEAEILSSGLVNASLYAEMVSVTRALFARGQEMASSRGLILVDTKYEFGLYDGQLMLMDEVHTPDSSRYFYADGFEERQSRGEQQAQLSKEFVREWLISEGFMGREGDQVPEMTDGFLAMVSERYIALYEQMTGSVFSKPEEVNTVTRIKRNIENWRRAH
ncbi:phosphoribosylaminoimidazolesuccinocarboxamide synthase [Flavobacteriales bacterium]|nr:phosphoribosylaminoimidazolesuccinocarboxamide synthase [Flavobacteriales bacterium]